MAVILETSIGDITVDLYTNERPRCCLNFLKLCKIKYYNFCLFHSVQRGLVAQTGDPLGTGKGGESIFRLLYGDQATYFDMELKPRIKHSKLGHISMVNNGSNMHGSQFFLTLAPSIDYLDGKHTVFGEVAEGFDVLQKLNEVYVDKENRPYKDIRIYHTVIIDDPFDDPPGLASHVPDSSPMLTREQLDSVRIGADEEIDDTNGMTAEEIEEMYKNKEAKAQAQILEMIGDLPEADVAPPDNVLFVCKLNPVTTDDDLEIIFSRFGKILSCEVIRDQKTGNSLQYAFIEFENPSDCENAYFKMDNVLIDDRRIHVDFSQSVSKLKWKGKGKGVEHVQEKDVPKYTVKSNQRRDDNYDLVFDDDDAGHKAASSSSYPAKDHKRSAEKHKRVSRSPSGDRAQYQTRKNRNRSPPTSGGETQRLDDSRQHKHHKQRHARSRSASSDDKRHAGSARRELQRRRSRSRSADSSPHKRKRSRSLSSGRDSRKQHSRLGRHEETKAADRKHRRKEPSRSSSSDDTSRHKKHQSKAHEHRHKQRSRSRSEEDRRQPVTKKNHHQSQSKYSSEDRRHNRHDDDRHQHRSNKR